MNQYEKREEEKRLHNAYYEHAKVYIQTRTSDGDRLRVLPGAHVHQLPDGAFVELSLWIPKAYVAGDAP